MTFRSHVINIPENIKQTEPWSWFWVGEPAYLHHLAVGSPCVHPSCTVRSVTGAAEAAVLDLLALQLHGGRPVADYADRFLESDALQGSLSRCCVTDIFGWLPQFLR